MFCCDEHDADITGDAIAALGRLSLLAHRGFERHSMSSDHHKQITLRVENRCVMNVILDTSTAGRIVLTTAPDGTQHGMVEFATLGELCRLISK